MKWGAFGTIEGIEGVEVDRAEQTGRRVFTANKTILSLASPVGCMQFRTTRKL
jgi:hypothetical protein